MESRDRPKEFLKFRHKSCVLTRNSITQLCKSGALDHEDFISLVFLMCDAPGMETVHGCLADRGCPDIADNFYEIVSSFTNWEQKLLEALLCVGNELALMELRLSAKDVKLKIKASSNTLSPSRVVLYKIFETLESNKGKKLVSCLQNRGAPISNNWTFLESYFMFLHVEGFLDLDDPSRFEDIVQALKDIDCGYLADSLLAPSLHLHHNSLSDDYYTLGVYQIRDPKKPGLCIIINQVDYGCERKNRDTSHLDRNKLQELMTWLNFRIIIMENVESLDFLKSILEAVQQSFEAVYSTFILIVMGHGDAGVVYCPDAKDTQPSEEGSEVPRWPPFLLVNPVKLVRLDRSRIKNPVIRGVGHVKVIDIQNTLLECEALSSKPKILIINACRGKDLFTTIPYLVAESAAPLPPAHRDLITCYSALPGFASLRPEKGSIFIQVLCNVLKGQPSLDVCDWFILVNALLMQPTPEMSEAFEPGKPLNTKKIASPCDFTSSLRKKLYLKMPNPSVSDGSS